MEVWRKRFLNSKQWRAVRARVIDRDMGYCRLCGEPILDVPEVHHVIALNERNYTNPAISLNPDLLETLHRSCHNIRHGRFGHVAKDSIVDDDCNIDYERRRIL